MQGAASAVESLGRTVGPVWGNASLQRFGEGDAVPLGCRIPAADACHHRRLSRAERHTVEELRSNRPDVRTSNAVGYTSGRRPPRTPAWPPPGSQMTKLAPRPGSLATVT